LVAKASKLKVARGKKVVELDLKKDKPTEEERAPTLVVGKSLVVGFNDQMYAGVFG